MNGGSGGGDARLWLVAIDTATSQVLVAAGTPEGQVIASGTPHEVGKNTEVISRYLGTRVSSSTGGE